MGLFLQRPEENDEWAGLPSEPLRQQTDAERLTDAAPVDLGGLDLLFGAGSISVLPLQVDEPATSDEPDEAASD